MHKDEKHIDIKKKLKNLPKVQASDDFVNSLQRKINLVEAEKSSSSIHKKYVDNIEKGFFAKILGSRKNPWLIPALGFTVVLFFIFTVVYINVKQNNLDVSEDQTKEDESAITLKTDEVETSKESIEDVETGDIESSGKEIAEDISTEGIDDLRAPEVSVRGYTESDELRKETKTSDKDEFTEGLIIEKQETYFEKTEDKLEEETGVEKEDPKTLETQKVEKKVDAMVRSKEEENKKVGDRKEKKVEADKEKEEIERPIKGLNEIDQSDLERLREEVIND
ncbi:MAG: hypothetical protein H8D45_31500 [Bacteroidetes bacterium]|nr:hypothetical protein [Bacteroidota bacterium]